MDMRRKNRIQILERFNSSGMTLVEVLITAILFSVLLGACLMLFLSGSNTWMDSGTQVEVQQELRKAVDWMRYDLQQAGASTITNVPADGAWYTSITFRTATGVSSGVISWSANTITFQRGGSGSTQLQRVSGGATKVLATSISTLQFRRQASSSQVVEVNVQTQQNTIKGRTMSASTTFKVDLRNS